MRKLSEIKIDKISLYMLGAILLTLLLAYKFTVDTQKRWTLPKGAATINRDLLDMKENVAQLADVAPTKPRDQNWLSIVAAADRVGVKVTPVVIKVKGLDSYQGNLKSWSGLITGDVTIVLSLVDKLQKELPIYLYTYAIEGKVIKLNFTCVGS